MFDFNTVLDINSLPVAPEFAEVLAENATKTAVEYLEAIHAPEQLVQLVRNISELGYYLEQCYQDPSSLLKDRNDRFDIEGIVVETINLIAQSGGLIVTPSPAASPPRCSSRGKNERDPVDPGAGRFGGR